MDLTPGVYPGLTAAAYHGWDLPSRSMLTKLADARHYTPADVRGEMLTSAPDSEAMALGSALHVAMLEPERYAEIVTLGPVNPKTGSTFGRGTKAWEEAADGSPGVTLLTTDQAARLAPMVSALHGHRRADAIFARCTEREMSLVVDLDLAQIAADYDLPLECEEADSHLLVKARIDMLCAGVALVADLKTTSASTMWELEKSITDYGYYSQSALYPYLARAAGMGDVRHFALIFVRSAEPYRVAVLRVTEESQRIGWQDLLPAMALAARCYRTDDWPGWPEEVVDVDVATWKLRQSAQ